MPPSWTLLFFAVAFAFPLPSEAHGASVHLREQPGYLNDRVNDGGYIYPLLEAEAHNGGGGDSYGWGHLCSLFSDFLYHSLPSTVVDGRRVLLVM